MSLLRLLPLEPPPTLEVAGQAQAAAMLAAWQLEALAITDGPVLCGVITPGQAELQPLPVLDVSSSAEDVRLQLRTAPAVAVLRGSQLAGLLTRLDLAPPASSALAAQVWAALTPEAQQLLMKLAGLAPQATVALVGGAVRDALLGLTPFDLDIVVVGQDVQALAEACGWPYVYHPAYRNATISADFGALDVVSARMEAYPHPGASPLPRPGTLSQDLRRRDFSLNALALVVGAGGPALHGPFGGLDDLAARRLRPLSAHSFTDDASRLVRGARLAALGLEAHPDLLAQVPDALAAAAQTPRLFAELRLMLTEPAPGRVAAVLEDWGAAALLPPGSARRLSELRERVEPPGEQLYAAALLSLSPDPARFADQLALGPRPAALLERALSHGYAAPGTPEAVLRGLLRPDAYVPLTGKDVLALGAQGGVRAGQQVGAALAYLASGRREGRFSCRQDEVDALLTYLGQPPLGNLS